MSLSLYFKPDTGVYFRRNRLLPQNPLLKTAEEIYSFLPLNPAAN
ncbi:hypothetical protein C1G86_1331 [Dehalococcoides mccartyi]|uniref:Uncharacterized protein n=2 Tax=Dehalococcoides mccartyi TaxID=61435 RepID=A0A142VD02_9CHLR|nr:hypothetical protein Dm11a5_1269 [Dehalococcoides mccartyi]RAL69075.1 hypothetical protein C1G87_1297 [Dehalococcoides mccartyi]RAL70394.1 hypothetical protein C1G86_1331 [Dehalococcoides mccartyi]CAI83446.1 hypothetical protein cbdbA1406 [Dehalococcoides mccartyi CBDB1]